MYKIVIFSDQNSCEGVPSSWVVKVGDETHCLWPKTTIANLNKMIKNGENYKIRFIIDVFISNSFIVDFYN